MKTKEFLRGELAALDAVSTAILGGNGPTKPASRTDAAKLRRVENLIREMGFQVSRTYKNQARIMGGVN